MQMFDKNLSALLHVGFEDQLQMGRISIECFKQCEREETVWSRDTDVSKEEEERKNLKDK